MTASLHCAKIYATAAKGTQCLAKIATNLAVFQAVCPCFIARCSRCNWGERGRCRSGSENVLGEREEQEKEPDRKTLQQNRRGALWLNRCIGK
jgi:hypothetical protein